MIGGIERVIAAISPAWALQREQHRQALDVMRSGEAVAWYDAARRDRHTDRMRRPQTGPNAELMGSLPNLRAAVRDLERNNAYAKRAPSAIASNAVGAGIVMRLTGPRSVIKRVQPVVDRWAYSTAPDADGRTTFYGLQHDAMREVASGGEVLLRRRRRRSTDKLPLPLQLQLLEGDWLDLQRDGPLPNGNTIVQGIEFNQIGRRVAYWLFDQHPGERTPMRTGESRPVPAEQIAHIARRDRPGQVHGEPWGTSIVMTIREFADYRRAQLIKQKVAGAFAAIVEKQPGPQIGGVTLGAADPNSTSNRPLEALRAGTFQYVAPGEKVTFPNPPTVEEFAEYSRVTLGEVATGYQVPYEVLTGDLSNVNFSSGRMGWLEFQRNLDVWRWNMLIPQGLDTVWSWLQESLVLAGFPEAEQLGVEWSPPHREMIQPKEEIAAMKEQRRLGIVSTSELTRRTGYDPQAVEDEIAAEQKRWREKELIFDGNPADDKGRQAGETADPEPLPEPEPAPAPANAA